mgnify:FL=1
MSKKVLVPGGTGAMGVYLIPELLKLGYEVDVISMDDVVSDNPKLRYFKENAKDKAYIEKMLQNGYDGVIDFMCYWTEEERLTFPELYLKNTGHYIFLSTYRVYGDSEHPIRETSPRIFDLDVPDKELLCSTGDYCIHKAQSEERLKASSYNNWTVVRPAITYSKQRFQLVTLEKDLVIRRMLEGKTLILPEPAMEVQSTMSWAGDVAKMLAGILFNQKAMREIYSVTTSEHHTWREVAEMYKEIGGLKYITVDTETFLNIWQPNKVMARHQLIYDRYYDRIMDNSKILELTGMKQSELMPLKQGLKMEFDALDKDNLKWADNASYTRMDAYLAENGLR